MGTDPALLALLQQLVQQNSVNQELMRNQQETMNAIGRTLESILTRPAQVTVPTTVISHTAEKPQPFDGDDPKTRAADACRIPAICHKALVFPSHFPSAPSQIPNDERIIPIPLPVPKL